MKSKERIEVGSISDIIERLQEAQDLGYKNLYLDIDTDIKTITDYEEDWYDDDDGDCKIARETIDSSETIERLSFDCDNIFLVKTIWQ